jgi:hypothetical protein
MTPMVFIGVPSGAVAVAGEAAAAAADGEADAAGGEAGVPQPPSVSGAATATQSKSTTSATRAAPSLMVFIAVSLGHVVRSRP